ncbi:HTTM domain-containing protein [Microbacterium stercoris]|uniref:HTTM domain-containing protein n=1 Tax=Microbacterium stercoris TaxID=2820289 RepID=A0A939TRT4_9MICO|nr:HTTM domain-containing protein [Microbacterium stercoris]MBO3664845.1 HTTM domain-containing protein [Microbacterium stercoris]
MIRTSAAFLGRTLRFVADLARRFSALLIGVAGALYSSLENWLTGAKHARYGLAIARFLLGVMFVGTALTNLPTAMYTFGAGSAWTGQQAAPTSSFAPLWPFSVVFDASPNAIVLILWLLIVCGVCFAIGYRTRLIMVPLFVLWIGFLSINPVVQDQSDNLSRIVMIAILFTASSDVWSVDAWRRTRYASNPGRGFLVRWWRFQPVLPSWMTALSHNIAVIVIGAQLCMIYASGGLFKAQGAPWYEGYAVYNPLQTAQFGTWPELSDLVTAWGPMVALATVMSVLVQVSFPLLLLRRGTRIFGLSVILIFHVSIAVLMGLPWFSLAMVALDAVFIRDITFQQIARAIRRSWQRARRREETPPAVPSDAERQEPTLVGASA